MKFFLRLLITIIVVSIISGTVYVFLVNESGNVDDNLEGKGNSADKLINDIIGSGESNYISGDIILEDSDESGEDVAVEDKVEKKINLINEIEDKIKIIKENEIEESLSLELSGEFLNDEAKTFMVAFETDNIYAEVNVRKNSVEIIPYSDFLENMVYYYDDSGDLMLYESVSNTIGGSSKYYFEKGQTIDVIVEYEEEVEKKEEYVFDVLNRSKIIYDRFLRK